MSEVLPRLYGLALEDWGVTKQDRLAARSDDPVRALIGRIASLLGVEETFDVYLARAVATRVEIEAGPPPALLVPAAVLSQPLQEACSQLGRQLGHLRAGTHGITRIPGKDLGLLVVAGVRTVYPDYGRGVLPEEQLNDVAQKIARLLPRRQRRAFEQAARVVPRRRRVRRRALARRPAAHGPPRGAAGVGRRAGGVRADRARRPAPRGRRAVRPTSCSSAARANPEVVEMINFAVSDELAAINRRLGVD